MALAIKEQLRSHGRVTGCHVELISVGLAFRRLSARRKARQESERHRASLMPEELVAYDERIRCMRERIGL